MVVGSASEIEWESNGIKGFFFFFFLRNSIVMHLIRKYQQNQLGKRTLHQMEHLPSVLRNLVN